MMKHLLLIAAFSLSMLASSAQLKLTEQFDNTIFTNSGDMGTTNSWIQTGTGPDVQVTYRTNNTNALTYTGYSSGRTSVSLGRYTSGGTGTDPYKNFNSAVATNSNGVLFMTFVLNVSAARNAGDYCIHYRTSSGNSLGLFFIKNNGSGFNVGLETDGGTEIYGSTLYNYNITYLIAIRYDIINGNNNDDMSLWVNPSVISEPTTGAEVSITNTGDVMGVGETISSLALRQAGSNAATLQCDAFRIAYGTGQATTDANASAAWANLNAAGAPLPVNFANVKAYSKGTGVQLDWSNMTETDVLNYVVERSSNGVDFTTVANIMAKQNDGGKADYGFYDATPAAVNYYRIQSLEGNNTKKYSVIVKVDTKATKADVVLYPNPVTGRTLSLQATALDKGQYTVRVTSASGQQVFAKSMIHAGGAVTSSVELPAAAKPGMYTLQIAGGNTTINKSFIVR
jgi:Secretion system C-terminal sorting domain